MHQLKVSTASAGCLQRCCCHGLLHGYCRLPVSKACSYAALESSLSKLTALTSLTLSSTAAQQFGAIKWAHLETVALAAGGPQRSADPTEFDARQWPSPFDQLFWIPDWLAAAPRE